MIAPSLRDQAAIDATLAAGRSFVPSIDSGAELEARDAVFLALAWHLSRVVGRIDDLTDTDSKPAPPSPTSFRTVLTRWPDAWNPALYPMAAIHEKMTTPRHSMGGTPFVNARGEDVVTDAWGLWLLGEDVGDGVISIFAGSDVEAKSLERAVISALFSDLSNRIGFMPSLPERYLPPAFRGLLDPGDFPRCAVWHAKGGTVELDERKSNAWRIDVCFRWQAQRFEARPRLPDLVAVARATVGPPGQEILPCSFVASAQCPPLSSCSPSPA